MGPIFYAFLILMALNMITLAGAWVDGLVTTPSVPNYRLFENL
jgi:hypothetical protein